MPTLSSLSIEVPCEQSKQWVTLTFYTSHVLAANHEPIKIERASRNTFVGKSQSYATKTLSKLRFMFSEHVQHQQIQMKTFASKESDAQPNKYAFNLALLLADLHFSDFINLPEQFAVEAGYCFSKGLFNLPSTTVAPDNVQDTSLNYRNSIVLKYQVSALQTYQAQFDFDILAALESIAPQNVKQACVYFPMVYASRAQAHSQGHSLGQFTVFYIPADAKRWSIIGDDVTFCFVVNDFVEHNIDLNLCLNGKVLIDCGDRPSKGHESWQLSLVSAIQLAMGVMPSSNACLICTGQVSTEAQADGSRILLAIGDVITKFDYVKSLKNDGVELRSMDNMDNDTDRYLFALPEENYYQLDHTDFYGVELVPVNYWYYEDLIV